MAGIVLREKNGAGVLFLQKITPQYKNALRTGFDFFDGEDFAACCDNREDILPRISAIVPLLMYLDKNEKMTYTLKRQ